MRLLRYSATAEDDVADIILHILLKTGSAETASTFAAKIDRQCAHPASLPGTLGTARPDLSKGLRSTPCQGYVIFFRYLPDTLEVVTILHGSRDLTAYFDEG